MLEAITGEKPVGFRAPNFSLNNSTKWALEILGKYGFKYDASVFPAKTMLYGVPSAPRHPYRPSLQDIAMPDKNGSIIEFPAAVLRCGRNFPVSGGFYFRVLPVWFQIMAIKRINRAWPAVLYFHPWEMYPGTPRLAGLSLFTRFIIYHGINRALGKLEALLRAFSFKPLRDFMDVV